MCVTATVTNMRIMLFITCSFCGSLELVGVPAGTDTPWLKVLTLYRGGTFLFPLQSFQLLLTSQFQHN